MRIPDERQLFNKGDRVVTLRGEPGIVKSVSSCSVYYEARPIASYTQFHYGVEIAGEVRHLKTSQLLPPEWKFWMVWLLLNMEPKHKIGHVVKVYDYFSILIHQ